MRADRRPRSYVLGLVTIYLAPVLVLVVSVALHQARGIDFGLVSRDQSQQFDAHPLVGAQSTLGGLAWFSGAAVAFFTVAVSRRTGRAPDGERRMLAALGGALLLLGIDDIFLLHDGLGPRYLGVDERPFIAVYVLGAIGFVAAFWRVALRREPLLLALAILFLAGSVGVDHFQEQLDGSDYRIFVEDAFKFLGSVGLSGYVIRQCWRLAIDQPAAAGQHRPRHRRRRPAIPGGSPL